MYGYDTFHPKTAEGLISNVRRGNPAQAYIFEGDRGLGIYDTARLFAASLACTGESAPCGACMSCIGAKSGNNPDIITVVPEPKKKTIGVEGIRDIITDAYVKPFLAKRKVYIFPDGGIMTEQAQNAFLKLLEEPPEYAVFIIIADNSDLLLETIRSRCVKVRFSPLSDSDMTAYVDKISPDNRMRDFIVRYSAGIPERAEKIIADEGFDELRKETVRKLPLLFSKRPLAAYSVCEFVEGRKEQAELILSIWAGLVRDIIFIQSGKPELITNVDFAKNLTEFAAKVDDMAAVRAAESILLAEEMLRRYVSLHSLVLRMALSIG